MEYIWTFLGFTAKVLRHETYHFSDLTGRNQAIFL
jgi:hypothetical protein